MSKIVSIFMAIPLLALSIPSMAQMDHANIARMKAYIEQKNQAWWNSLTPRQRYLDKMIGLTVDQHYQQYGQLIPPTHQNISIVMNNIGANSTEYSFVAQRLQANYEHQEILNEGWGVINETDQIIQNIMRY